MRSMTGKVLSHQTAETVAFREIPGRLAENLFLPGASGFSAPFQENRLSEFKMELQSKCAPVQECLVFYFLSLAQKSATRWYFEGLPVELECKKTIRKR